MSDSMIPVREHYTQPELGTRLLGALGAAGKTIDRLTREDIATFDEFHIMGREATRGLARLAGVAPNARVLDLGSGIGGPARTLAEEFGASVVGLDLTDEYCRAAQLLTERVGLGGRVEFRQGSALDIPFDDGSFDAVWLQHVGMNIRDKRRMVAEIRRVLQDGGRFALHEICAGAGGAPHYPVPWANDASISHLIPPDDYRSLIREAGFREVAWVDLTSDSHAWFDNLVASMKNRPADAPPPLGLNLLMGTDTPIKAQNLARNLGERRVVVIQAVFEPAY